MATIFAGIDPVDGRRGDVPAAHGDLRLEVVADLPAATQRQIIEPENAVFGEAVDQRVHAMTVEGEGVPGQPFVDFELLDPSLHVVHMVLAAGWN